VTVTNDIRAALELRLLATPDIPTVVPENVKYDPDPNTPFVRCKTVITNRTPSNMGLNPMLRYDGFFRMLVCWPTAEGVGDATELVDTLLSRFEATTDLDPQNDVYVRIIDSIPNAGYDDINLPFYCIPVTASWYSYH
jgi:hypothetical protein